MNYTPLLHLAGGDVTDAQSELIRIAELAKGLPQIESRRAATGRNRFTRSVDSTFAWLRSRARPVHSIGLTISAAFVFLYTRILALTARLRSASPLEWPPVPAPCVLAVWHGSAPSLLVAIIASRIQSRIAIMIARDPRGDFLALLCSMLGLRVVRGDSDGGGWEALASLAKATEDGYSAVITADGGGPARHARVGAVALATATRKPLVPVGADCGSGITERRKWDSARIPLPFSRIAISLGERVPLDRPSDSASLEAARRELESELEHQSAIASQRLRGSVRVE